MHLNTLFNTVFLIVLSFSDQQLYLSFNLNDLKSFSRVVPIHGSTPYMTFSLKDNTRTWPLEFPSGGTRELIRSFQGILEYKR